MDSDTHIAHLLGQPTSFTPSFTSERTVILPHDIKTVFDKLGRGEAIEPSVRLSDLCTMFRLTMRDYVALKEEELGQVRCRGLPPAPSGEPAGESEGDGERVLTRQFFVMQESIPLLFGLYTHITTVAGCFTSDPARKAALYESSAFGGILVWKLRTFEELALNEGEAGAKTKVSERMEVRAPILVRGIVEKETRRVHAYVVHLGVGRSRAEMNVLKCVY
jgi:hypothetical protein